MDSSCLEQGREGRGPRRAETEVRKKMGGGAGGSGTGMRQWNVVRPRTVGKMDEPSFPADGGGGDIISLLGSFGNMADVIPIIPPLPKWAIDYPEFHQRLTNYTGPIESIDEFGVPFYASINHVHIKRTHALFNPPSPFLVPDLSTNTTATTAAADIILKHIAIVENTLNLFNQDAVSLIENCEDLTQKDVIALMPFRLLKSQYAEFKLSCRFLTDIWAVSKLKIKI